MKGEGDVVSHLYLVYINPIRLSYDICAHILCWRVMRNGEKGRDDDDKKL